MSCHAYLFLYIYIYVYTYVYDIYMYIIQYTIIHITCITLAGLFVLVW